MISVGLATRRMESKKVKNDVSTGVQKTEIGLIPLDWIVVPLSEICIQICDGTHYTPSYVNGGVPFYSVENITSDDFENTKYISEEAHAQLVKRCMPQRGDILMTRITAGILGATKLIDWDVKASIYVSLALLKLNPSCLPNYIYQYTKSQNFRDAVERRGLVNATPKKINMGEIGNILIPIPSTLAEQDAIASALSDADALIEGLEKLIAKKRHIKQGAMQELLTGKHRLPGFDGEWRETTLGEIAHIKTGSRNNQDKAEGAEYPFFVRSECVERIDTFSYDCEAILIPGEGGIGSIFHYINGRFDAHQRVYVISQFSDDVVGQFVHLFMKQYFGLHAMQNTVKATVDSLRLPTFQNFTIRLPVTVDEQRAIAMALSNMDDELCSLGHRLSKARQIKQGMMQELLTGRIRLV